MPTTKTRRPGTKAGAPPPTRMTLAEAMAALEKGGSAQTKKTYARHGASEPMFGTSFATIATIVKRAGVDQDLAFALWETGNFDARNLAFKVADPSRMKVSDLERWARETKVGMSHWFVGMLAAEGPKGLEAATRWLASSDEGLRSSGWRVVQQLAGRDEKVPDAWFEERLAEIERTIRTAPNALRDPMNTALISIGGRSPALRKAALAAAKRIGKVEVDHGDTSCKTPEAAPYVEKMWAHAKAKGYDSPSAQERDRKPPRTRC